MRVRSFVPWVLVATTSLGGLGVGPLFSRAHAQAIKEPGWPPPEGAACKPSAGDDEEAKTLYKLAEKAENTSNYTDAIKYYKDAYRRACNRHLLLKNLGRAYEKDAQYAAAVEAYKLYRARGKPTGEELDLIDAKIANLSKKVGGGTEPTTTAPTGTGTPTTTATGTDTAPTSTAVPTATAAPTTTATGPVGGEQKPNIVPWIVAGAGAAIFIGGTIVWISANSTVSDKQDEFTANRCAPPNIPANRDLCQQIKSDGEDASSTRTIGAVVAGVGIAVAAGGVIWALTSKKKEPAAALRITPGPTFAGIGLSGSF